LNEKPKNDEYAVWKNIYKLPAVISLSSKVVHGFGRGGKKLGIPTGIVWAILSNVVANLDMTPEIQEKLADLVTGVYYGHAEFIKTSSEESSETDLEYDKLIPMVMSIGFNPYFNNKYKTAVNSLKRKFLLNRKLML